MAGLELGPEERRAQDSRHRRRAVRVRRAGWAAFALLIAAALAGLLGPGPLSWTSRSSAAGDVAVEYERFSRYTGDTILRVRIGPVRGGAARLWISDEYLSAVDIQQVVPEPTAWTATGGGVVLSFPVGGRDDRVDARIRLSLTRIGLVRGEVGLPGREPVEFWQFVYP